MAPASCALDAPALKAQLARYQAVGAGAGAAVRERTPRRLVLTLAPGASEDTGPI